MKVAGQATLHAPVERVWAALNDPAVLVRAIPGCQRLEPTGPDAYAMTVTAGVASIKGSYAGSVQLTEQQEPNSFVLRASGAGGPGTVTAQVSVRLSEQDGATLLDYDADAVVGGVIGGVGQRMLAGVAKKLAGEFFANVDAVLTGTAVEPEPSAVSGDTSTGAFHTASVATGRTAARPVEFILGAVFGAVTALAGVLVGVRVAARVAGDSVAGGSDA